MVAITSCGSTLTNVMPMSPCRYSAPALFQSSSVCGTLMSIAPPRPSRYAIQKGCIWAPASPSFRRLTRRDTALKVELQDVVEAVEGAAQGRAPCHLDDLRLAEMLLEAGEDLIARSVPIVGNSDRILDDELVDRVELGVILVVEQPRRAGLRDG